MFEALTAALATEPRIVYAIVFGSAAKGTAHPASDVDVAIGFGEGPPAGVIELGGLAAKLESAVGHPVDLVLLDEAPPGLAYRVFRDGVTIVARDGLALASRRARAILEYLDFRPIEDLCTRGVLTSAHGR